MNVDYTAVYLRHSALFAVCSLGYADYVVFYRTNGRQYTVISDRTYVLCSWFYRVFSNHSLRATCATRMFDAGVYEQLIMAKTPAMCQFCCSWLQASQ